MAGPEPNEAVRRVRAAARISRVRTVGSSVVALLIVGAAPLIANQIYERDAELVRTGTPSEVTVAKTERGFKGECRRVYFVLDGREQSVCDYGSDPGENIRVISDGNRVLPADRDLSRRRDLIGGTALGAVIAVAVIGFGAGPGVAPRRAWRAARRSSPTSHTRVTVSSARPVVPPQGWLYAWWRRRPQRRFYELQLVLPDGRSFTWIGLVPTYSHHLGNGQFETRAWVQGEAQLVSEIRPGGWAWLVPPGRRRISPPAAALVQQTATAID